MWFIGVEAEQETSAPPPKKNPGSAPVPQDTLRNFPVSPIKFQQHNFGFNWVGKVVLHGRREI